jgi:hypothetical protein
MAGVKAAQERVSDADLKRWPDGRRYELYDGEVFEIPSPIPLHQFVLGRLHLALSAYVQAHGGAVFVAPLDIVLTDFDVVLPDVLLFMPEREHLLHMRRSRGTRPTSRSRFCRRERRETIAAASCGCSSGIT